MNSWVGTDPIVRDEFNINFQLLDDKTKAHDDKVNSHETRIINNEAAIPKKSDQTYVDAQLLTKAANSDLNLQKARIDTLVTNVGNTSGNSEIVDIRTGYDGYVHTSAGNAARNQSKWLPIVDLSVAANYVGSSYIVGITSGKGGVSGSSPGYRRTNAIVIPLGVKTIEIRNWQTNQYILNAAFYSSSTISSSNMVGYSSAYEVGVNYSGVISIPTGATYVVFSCPDSQILRPYWYRDELQNGVQSTFTDIQTGYDGYVHSAPGTAVREQLKMMPVVDITISANYVEGSFIGTNGNIASAANYRRSNAVPIPYGAKTLEIRNWQVNSALWNVAFYSSNTISSSTLVGHSSAYETGSGYTGVISIPSNATYVVLTCPDNQIIYGYWYRDEILGGVQGNFNDIASGYDGYVHNTAGNSVRNQVKWLPVTDFSKSGSYIEDSYISGSTKGSLVTGSANSGYRRSNTILIPAGAKTVEVRNWQSNQYILNVAFYNSPNISVSTMVGYSSAYETGSSYNGIITIPAGATYVVFSCPDSSIIRAYWYRDEILAGIQTTLSSVQSSNTQMTNFMNSKITAGQTDFAVEAGKNLLNTATLGQTGYWASPSTGVIGANQYVGNTIKPTDYISVKPNTSYVHNLEIWGIAYYDINKVFISYDEAPAQPANTARITPTNCYYIIVNLKDNSSSWTTSFINSILIQEGTVVIPHTIHINNLVIDGQVPQIDLPQNYYAIIGDTLEIFNSGVVRAENYTNYYITWTVSGSTSKGTSYRRKWTYTPVAGDTNFTLTLSIYDNNGTLLNSAVTTINVLAKKTSVSSASNVICMGDSLTYQGVWAGELKRRLTSTGGTPVADGLTNLNFVGNCFDNNVHYEGYGGWTWGSYTSAGEVMYWATVTSGMKADGMQESTWTDGTNQWVLESIDSTNGKLKFKHTDSTKTYVMPASGTLTWVSGGGSDHTNIVFSASTQANGNPFWNPSTSAVDFSYYCNNLGITSVDYILVLLGWNSVLNANTDITAARSFIDKLHAAFPNCKVVVSGLQVPSEDGWGYNYGTNTNGEWIKDYPTLKGKAHELNGIYESWCHESAYSNFLIFSHLMGQFDMEYNYDYITAAPNVRSTSTVQIQTNAVHPSTNGRLQIADAMYRTLQNILG